MIHDLRTAVQGHSTIRNASSDSLCTHWELWKMIKKTFFNLTDCCSLKWPNPFLDSICIVWHVRIFGGRQLVPSGHIHHAKYRLLISLFRSQSLSSWESESVNYHRLQKIRVTHVIRATDASSKNSVTTNYHPLRHDHRKWWCLLAILAESILFHTSNFSDRKIAEKWDSRTCKALFQLHKLPFWLLKAEVNCCHHLLGCLRLQNAN